MEEGGVAAFDLRNKISALLKQDIRHTPLHNTRWMERNMSK